MRNEKEEMSEDSLKESRSDKKRYAKKRTKKEIKTMKN